MSKFSDSIRSHITGKKIPISDRSFLALTSSSSSDINTDTIQYRISATFSSTIFLNPQIASSGHEGHDELKEAQRSVSRSFVEEMFGEFRPLIIEMNTAIYQEDSRKLKELLNELEHRMFNV
jgi:hypothetical protein